MTSKKTRRANRIAIVLAAGAAAVASAAPAVAQSDVAAQPAAAPAAQAQTPPCQSALFRQFDFWVGEWDVFSTTGQKLGENSIKIEEGGCLLVERWTSANGGTGQSYNYVDLGAKKWRQIWVASWGTIDYAGGLNEDGAMALEGEIAYPTGQTNGFKGLWTPNDDGTVTQYFEQYDAETETYKPWFKGIYKKKPE